MMMRRWAGFGEPGGGWRRAAGPLATVGGLALAAGAGVFAAAGAPWGALAHAPPWIAGALAGAVAVNVGLTAALLWAVTLCFDADPPVGLGKMAALVAASGLVNYLPAGIPGARLGMLGRAAYLKARHQLPWRQSVVILVIVLGLGVAVLGWVGGVLVLMARWPGGRWVLAAVGLGVMTGIATLLGRALPRLEAGRTWLWVPARVGDLAAATVRLWLALKVLGVTAHVGDAAVMASASLLVRLAGITPNGLGLSEWAVAAVAAAISPIAASAAAGAALVDRAAEVLVMIVLGGAGLAMLRRPRAPSHRAA